MGTTPFPHLECIPLWERACSRKRCVIQLIDELFRRLREQAPSHIDRHAPPKLTMSIRRLMSHAHNSIAQIRKNLFPSAQVIPRTRPVNMPARPFGPFNPCRPD
ncbi:hypothetical protein FHG55_13675 [Pseudomonas jessenii]|uniref:Uncharacterized protein n=1 Tax=Pseudomonas jessenii TaxID=77298 RepID=A0A5C4KY77_PSEJE|nr:hypothetical protein FHG55_13675 [Pseudomonas jessenii]